MFKKIIAYAVILSLFVTGMNFTLAYADEPVDVSEQQAALDAIAAQRAALQKEIDSGKAVVNSLNKEITNLENQISLSQLEINELAASINLTQAKINNALADLDKLEQDIAQQNEELNKRLRTMYKNGSVGFLDVLLGSSGISELMTNLDRVQRIYDNDKEVLAELQTQHEAIDTQRAYLLGLQDELEASKEQEAQKTAALNGDKAVVSAKKAEASSDVKALEEQENALIAEANALAAEIRKLQGDQAYAGGTMLWPVPGVSRITSPFGYRIHPILGYKKLHTGIDIGAGSGTTVVAANAGTVIKAGWNNSYGNMVMIDHGGSIVTLYAHNSSLLVSAGTVVSAGQAIALSGSTGMSTGPHVHFEVRVNGDYVDPLGYVSP